MAARIANCSDLRVILRHLLPSTLSHVIVVATLAIPGMILGEIVGAGLFYLVIFASGVWLSRSGKPFNVILLTIHKLISLAAAAFLAITVCQINRVATLGTIEWIAGVVTGLLFLATIVSGGLLSIDKPMPAAVLTMHQITPWLTVLSTAVTLYPVLGRS